MDNDKKERKNEWSNHPIIICTGMLVMYTVSNSIIALLNL
ncbi:MAG: hypothetical protein H6Q68_3692 [Firmicutes bacterium]|nr:hypothetical protein [Bacillota bacterium]